MNENSYSEFNLQEGYLLHGHYRIHTILGRGGFSFTYKAQDMNLDRFVAVKEYFPSSIAARSGITVAPIDSNSIDSYSDGLLSFIKEAQTLAKFRNEHICSVLDYFQDNGTAYLIMPYLSGETLDMVLNRCPNGIMNSEAVRRWLIPLLGALKEIHAASYMHRDIKPSNIYITFEGEPILIDFGAARASVGRTHGYTVVLTPEYAPPEQSTTDIASQGPWTDIFALAAVAYRCLIGTPPPDAQKRILAIANGENDPLDSNMSMLEDIADTGLYSFIKKGLILPYAKRIQTINESCKLLNIQFSKNEYHYEDDKIIINCPSCSQKLRIPRNKSLIIKCSKCSYEFMYSEDGKTDSFISSKSKATFFVAIFIITFVILCIYNKDFFYNTQIQTEYHTETKTKEGSENNRKQNSYQSSSNQTKDDVYKIVSKSLDEGIKNYKARQYGLAISEFDLCLSYKNVNRSQELLEKQATCANYLAVMLTDGRGGLPINKEAAFKLLDFAARAGNRAAQYNLAKRYKNGVGTTQNTKDAVYWYAKAAQAGDVDAAKTLGRIFEYGHGNVLVDIRVALEWYKYAYRLNSKDTDINEAIRRINKNYNLF